MRSFGSLFGAELDGPGVWSFGQFFVAELDRGTDTRLSSASICTSSHWMADLASPWKAQMVGPYFGIWFQCMGFSSHEIVYEFRSGVGNKWTESNQRGHKICLSRVLGRNTSVVYIVASVKESGRHAYFTDPKIALSDFGKRLLTDLALCMRRI